MFICHLCHDHRSCRGGAQGFREAVSGASSELFTPEGKEAESAVVKKLKQPKKSKKKKEGEKKDKKKGGDSVESEKEGEEEEGEEGEEEEEKGGVRGLMIVKTAGEAWERLQERLKESPIIQARRKTIPGYLALYIFDEEIVCTTF